MKIENQKEKTTEPKSVRSGMEKHLPMIETNVFVNLNYFSRYLQLTVGDGLKEYESAKSALANKAAAIAKLR